MKKSNFWKFLHWTLTTMKKNIHKQLFTSVSRFDLPGRDSWLTTRFWIFTTEFSVIIEPFYNNIRYKLLESSMDLWHINNMKVIVTFRTFNYVDFVPISCTDSFYVVHNRDINLKTPILEFLKNMIIPPLIWVFDFMG